MAGITVNRGYPYPGGADVFNTAVDLQALANALDVDVEALSDALTAHSALTTPVNDVHGSKTYVDAAIAASTPTVTTLAKWQIGA